MNNIVIDIINDNKVTINDETITLEELPTKLSEILNEYKEINIVHLRIADGVGMGTVDKIREILQTLDPSKKNYQHVTVERLPNIESIYQGIIVDEEIPVRDIILMKISMTEDITLFKPTDDTPLDGKVFKSADIRDAISRLLTENDNLVVLIQPHPDIKYGVLSGVLDQLKQAGAHRIIFKSEQ